MSDDAAFVAAILEDPDNDLPRLLYSDWLDERGEGARAEFIRAQCELADKRCVGGCAEVLQHIPCPLCRLRARERELVKKHFGEWTESLPESMTTKQCGRCADQAPDFETNVIECRRCDCTGLELDEDNVEFRRGFMATIRTTAAEWQRELSSTVQGYYGVSYPGFTIGQAILTQHPIQRVEFTDVEDRALRINLTAGWHHSEKRWTLELEDGSEPENVMLFGTRGDLIGGMPHALREWDVTLPSREQAEAIAQRVPGLIVNYRARQPSPQPIQPAT